MTNIIERTTGATNKSMWDYCEALKRVILQKKDVVVGRGKNIETIELHKYKNKPETVERILNSCEHYKKLHEMESKQGFKFRDYQIDIIEKGTEILFKYGFLYLAMEVRTGKTLTSLGIAERSDARNVLFITKKKALSSISDDFSALSPSYYMQVINYESLHTVMDERKWDLIVCDEAHGMGAFPKPSGRAELVSEVIRRCRPMVILLSGTPTPESYSQMYHQVYAIPNNPFKEFKNFYRFCDKYVAVKQRKINGLLVKDYSGGLESIIKEIHVAVGATVPAGTMLIEFEE